VILLADAEQAGRFERVVVAGGGVAGLSQALLLGRAGWPVTVLERDVDVAGSDANPEAAFAVGRRGAPQTHQTHGFLARLRLELRDRLPDVLAALHEAGAHTLPLTRDLGEPRPDDDDLAILIVRRTTLEWVLRRAVAAEPNIELRTGRSAVALVGGPPVAAAADGGGRPLPHVAGVRLDDGSLVSGIVVACTGNRGDVPRWLGDLGVAVPTDEHQTRLIYLTRWYRLPAGQPVDTTGRLFGDLGYLRYLVVPGDGGTLSATLAVESRDTELRAQLLDGDSFDRAVRRLPGPDQFFTPGPVEPLGPVRPMAGLVNRLRRFTDAAGQPLVTGFHAVGDAHTCTNPLYGRGCALALVQAGLLLDALAAYPTDHVARVAAYEAGSTREVEPWFHASVQMDQLRDTVEARAARRRARAASAAMAVVAGPAGNTGNGAAAARPAAVPGDGGKDGNRSDDEGRTAGSSPAAILGRIMVEGGSDPIIGRAIIRLLNLLCLPQDLLADPELVARVGPLLAGPPQAPPEPEGPSLAELLA
jgi:2-polyprenyl-6-methoxyphenol hydroxylase-like FAD-dependent oxidoreductase